MHSRNWSGLVGMVAALAFVVPLKAQSVALNAAAEAGGDEVHLLFSVLARVGEGTGWRPVGTIGGYLVLTEGENSWGLTPAAGLRYATDGGFLQGQVGWALRDEEGSPFFGGDESGLHTALHAEFWGEGTWSAQGLASYNWGADYLWSRARLARRLAALASGGGVALGGELVWQADTDDQTILGVEVDGYQATQIGPVLQWTTRGGGPVLAFSGGWKNSAFGDVDDDTWYARAELYLPLR